jgi:hypothetical protein
LVITRVSPIFIPMRSVMQVHSILIKLEINYDARAILSDNTILTAAPGFGTKRTFSYATNVCS